MIYTMVNCCGLIPDLEIWLGGGVVHRLPFILYIYAVSTTINITNLNPAVVHPCEYVHYMNNVFRKKRGTHVYIK
jgi:hypothetical protein